MNSCNFEVIIVLGLTSITLFLLQIRIMRISSRIGIQTLFSLFILHFLTLLPYIFLAVITVTLEQLFNALLSK